VVIASLTSFDVLASVAWHADPAAADPLSECSTTTGEIVVVDFAAWGGDIERGCAGTLTTGYNAMISAGFTPSGTEQEGPAFVCRIDDEPPPSQQSCVDTPPASASWSYWHADAGQNTWTYSSLGAMSYEPPPGSVDAWTFGAADPNVQPPFTPSSVRANNQGPPVTTTTNPTTTSTQSTSPRGSSQNTSPKRTSPGATSPGSTSPTLPASKAPSGGTTTPTIATTPISVGRARSHTDSAPKSSPRSSGPTNFRRAETSRQPALKIVNVSAAPSLPKASTGSPVAFLAGGLVVVCLAGAWGFAAWRRRRAQIG
jgi:hypothetical protein